MMIILDRLNEIAVELTVECTSDLLVTGTAPALIEHLALSAGRALGGERIRGLTLKPVDRATRSRSVRA